jgi:hypothetical protein
MAKPKLVLGFWDYDYDILQRGVLALGASAIELLLKELPIVSGHDHSELGGDGHFPQAQVGVELFVEF